MSIDYEFDDTTPIFHITCDSFELGIVFEFEDIKFLTINDKSYIFHPSSSKASLDFTDGSEIIFWSGGITIRIDPSPENCDIIIQFFSEWQDMFNEMK